MRSTIRPIPLVFFLFATLVIGGCYNSKMVGAASKVTGGRVFKTAGLLNKVEQQLLFDLQGLGLAPGDLMRNGGLGDQGMHYTLEYTGEQSALQEIEYEFQWDGEEDLSAEAFVATVGAHLERLDRLGGELTDAKVELKQLTSKEDKEDLLDRLGSEAEKLDPEMLEQLLKYLDSAESAQHPHSGGVVHVMPASHLRFSDEKSVDDEDDRSAPKQTPRQLRRQEARDRVRDIRERIRETSESLDRILLSGRNYLIFRWSNEQSGSADVKVADPIKFSTSESNASSGFVVAAGLRRSRLLLGRDLKFNYRHVDPDNRLVKWFEDPWSATGYVTETFEVQHHDYFATGQSERASKIVAAFKPSDFAGLTALDLLDLKLSVELNDERLTSYANRAMLMKPKVTTEPYDFSPPTPVPAEGTSWTTLWAVATSLDYLEDIGRLER